MTVLELLCAKVQQKEQEKFKTKQKQKFDVLLSNAQEWKGHSVHGNR